MSESDGIQEALEGALRVALTTAMLAGAQLARQREARARAAQAADEQTAGELGARTAAERQAARAALQPVQRSEWWEQARPDDIARAYQTAVAWRDADPDAARAEQQIVDRLRDRYGIDLHDPASVRAAMDEAVRTGTITARPDGREEREAVTLVQQADLAEQGAGDRARRPEPGTEPVRGQARDAGVAYDSRERRQQMAAELSESADRETVQARVLADTSQAKPAAEATWTASTSSVGAAAASRRQPQRAPGPMNLSERIAAANHDRGMTR